eukprot:TRINITY_DN20030_c0_g1_i1.p1 TRINITY_DN20030_c0_g1~~TRINITY_DN20030_c0_g1_i1.p1  ORF type:complete len:559 (-),score=153.46 TRINITY_DN20030_c0_g1_i1:14-1690(-)
METASGNSFSDLLFFDNPLGWGPTEESIPAKFIDVPHAQYRKTDSLSKVADNFGSVNTKSRGDYTTQMFHSQTPFNTYGTEDPSSFQFTSDFKKKNLRSSARSNKDSGTWQQAGGYKSRQVSRNTRDFNNKNPRGQGNNRNPYNKNQRDSRPDYRNNPNRDPNSGPYKKNNYRQDKVTRDTSVEIKADWEVIESIDFAELRKTRGEIVSDPETIKENGSLGYYDNSFDNIEIRNNTPLVRQGNEKTSPNSTTTDDEIIREMSLEYAQKYPDYHIFFTTDSILSHLMTCPRSVYSWDVIIRKVGNAYFFDKREDSNLDLPTVNETSGLPSNQNEEQSAERLSMEAGYINRVFAQQALSKNRNTINRGDGVGEDEAPVLYRYRKWDLGDNNLLIVRCEVNCVVEEGTKVKYGLIKALNEFDPKVTGVDWRQSLETQRGTVLATEIKNNAHKLAKWTASAMLGGCEWLKLGYVSRGNRGMNAGSHVVLAVQSWRPLEFGPQSMGLSIGNLWGVWKVFMELSKGLKSGTHVLVKDPAKGVVRLYAVPDDAFEEGDAQEEEDA